VGRGRLRVRARLHLEREALMSRIRLEVCPQKRGAKPWKVTKGGELWAETLTQTHGVELAVTLAHQMAARGDLVTLKIKRPDGRIRDERTYPRSSDPKRSKG
jgi:hypothetical protein